MKTKSIVNFFLFIVFSIGIYGSGTLVYNEITTSNICPKIINIPACYIILVCFIIPLIVHITKFNNFIYFIFIGLAFSIALIASVMEILNLVKCPKTSNGHPMCYYSLLLFGLLIIFKIILLNHQKKSIV